MQADRRSAGGSRNRPVPQRQEAFAHLTLDGLRAYRRALTDEEGRVSYWRRIIQARLDLLRASERAGGTATVDQLRGVFAEKRIDGGRTAILRIVPVDDMPPLPDLGELWRREPIPGDDAHNDRLVHELASAEAQLSAYRAALHRRLGAATGELIARYRENPLQCLDVLPTRAEPVARAVLA